jgi:hypothetical protein
MQSPFGDHRFFGGFMNSKLTQDSKRIIHSQHHVLAYVSKEALPYVARGFAQSFNIPTKVMLKAMKRYVRLHHSHKGAL